MRCPKQRFAAALCAVALFLPAPLCARPNPITDDIVRAAVDAYGKVNDYTATLFRIERVGGKPRKEERIGLKFRKPDSIYMKWETSPNPGLLNQGTEVIYPAGKGRDKMTAHLGGLINLVTPTITVSPTDRLVMENNRHPVTHTGIGYILDLFVRQRDRAVADKDFLQVYHGTVEIMGRKTHKVEYIMPGKAKGYYCYRAEVYFDGEHKLPIRIVVYDWSDEEVERYSFRDLKVNVGLTEDDFNPRSRAYNF
jgi:outer membrane lipoprotein-sorting protein